MPAKVVSERLGHVNIAITLDAYSHVLPRMNEAAASAFGSMLRGPVEQVQSRRPDLGRRRPEDAGPTAPSGGATKRRNRR
ncbi:hypothetical protein [Nitriliruptor alkaliphilus]|uniref:hypothetical protein n=1 Tax=Nitriliruptor alkaliphilus TaxID=427918 RepID=UPI001B806A50|nr:hypothetical protein [Nitriliruptor alkaliphilus]